VAIFTLLQNDIAIIELERPVSFRAGIRPACLPDQFAKQVRSGVGRTRFSISQFANHSLETRSQSYDHDLQRQRCKNLQRNY
jgi:hypothetical protein